MYLGVNDRHNCLSLSDGVHYQPLGEGLPPAAMGSGAGGWYGAPACAALRLAHMAPLAYDMASVSPWVHACQAAAARAARQAFHDLGLRKNRVQGLAHREHAQLEGRGRGPQPTGTPQAFRVGSRGGLLLFRGLAHREHAEL